MAKRKRRPEERGHYCWCCELRRPNERFGGRGHRDHLCRDCQRLPAEERAYRQAVRNMRRLVDWEGLIRRKARPQLDPFLNHPLGSVRSHAEELLRQDARIRAEIREAYSHEVEASFSPQDPLGDEGAEEEFSLGGPWGDDVLPPSPDWDGLPF